MSELIKISQILIYRMGGTIRRNIIVAAIVLFMLGGMSSSALFANVVYFPQVPYGGGYTTTFVVMNTGTTTISSTAYFYSQSGGAVTNTPVSIPAGGSTRWTYSLASSQINVIWGYLDAGSGTVQAVATFDLRASNGTLIATAGVLAAQAGNNFLLPVDITATAGTGIAIANLTTTPVIVGLQLLGQNGSVVATATDVRFNPLHSLGQVADFVTNIFPQFAGTTFSGTLAVNAGAGAPSNALAATALTVKEGLLSALPVIPVASSLGGTGGTTGAGTASVVFQTSLTGGATLQFQGKTFITDGLETFTGIAPGTYQITGTLPVNGSASWAFANGGGLFGSGGVLPGSLKSLAGPSGIGTIVSACNVIYTNVSSSTQTYTLQFTVTTSTTAACQTGQ